MPLYNRKAYCYYNRRPPKNIDDKLAQIIFRQISDWISIETLKDTYFNKININSLPNVLAHFKGILSPNSQELLFNIILLSRESNQINIASSNAATILARVGYPFTNKNLSGIKIPSANLSGSLFINTDLSYSDLSNAILSQSHFYFTNFENCAMQNAKFGELPDIAPKETSKIKECHACFSPCGKYLAISRGNNLKIRDLENSKNVKELKHVGSKKIFWSPCGNYICLLSEIWMNMIEIKKNYQILQHKVDINPESFCFSKNWKYWGSCKQTFGIQCYSVTPKKRVYENSKGKMFYKQYYEGKFLFSNCENYMIIGSHSILHIFQINSWSLVKKVKCDNWYSSFSLSSTPFSDYILLSFLNCVQLINIKTEESIGILKETSYIGFSQYEKYPLIYVADNYIIKIIDLENQKTSKSFFGNSRNYMHSIACSPCGNYIAPVTSQNKIEVHECLDICPNIDFNGHFEIIKSIEVSESGNYMLTSSQGQAILWDIKNKFQIKKVLSINHNCNCLGLAISRTDNYFAVFMNNQLYIGNIPERKVIKQIQNDYYYLASFSHWNSNEIPSDKNDNFLTLYSKHFYRLQLVDIKKNTTKRASSSIKSKADPLGFSPCGNYFFSKYAISSKSWRIRIWSMKIMRWLTLFDVDMNAITDFAASYPAQQFIFTLIEDKRIAKIFIIANYDAKELHNIKFNFWKEICSAEDICQIAFSYCQRYIIACQDNKLITIWNLETENIILRVNSLCKAPIIMKFAVTSCVEYMIITENNFFWVLNLKDAITIFERNDKDICDIYKFCLVWHSMNGNLVFRSCNFSNANLSQNNLRLISSYGL